MTSLVMCCYIIGRLGGRYAGRTTYNRYSSVANTRPKPEQRAPAEGCFRRACQPVALQEGNFGKGALAGEPALETTATSCIPLSAAVSASEEDMQRLFPSLCTDRGHSIAYQGPRCYFLEEESSANHCSGSDEVARHERSTAFT